MYDTGEAGAECYSSLPPNLSVSTNTGQKTNSPTCVVTLAQKCGLMANPSTLTLANHHAARPTRLLFQAGIRGTDQSRCGSVIALSPEGEGVRIGSAFTRAVEWIGDSSCLSVSRSVFLSSAKRMMRVRDATFCALFMAAVLAHSCVGGEPRRAPASSTVFAQECRCARLKDVACYMFAFPPPRVRCCRGHL